MSDINECDEGTDGCAQTCTDAVSGYVCSCRSGYRLASDRHGCNGKLNVVSLLHTYKITKHTPLIMSATWVWQMKLKVFVKIPEARLEGRGQDAPKTAPNATCVPILNEMLTDHQKLIHKQCH